MIRNLARGMHIAVCIAAIIVQWCFLDKFSGHFENGMWDSNAITATVLLVLGIAASAMHLTFFFVKESRSIMKKKE